MTFGKIQNLENTEFQRFELKPHGHFTNTCIMSLPCIKVTYIASYSEVKFGREIFKLIQHSLKIGFETTTLLLT